MKEVYLDNSATTPIHPEVAQAMVDSMSIFGNASSVHHFGRKARERVEEARANLAKLIGAEPSEVVFTSGGSESNNFVLKGMTCSHISCRPRGALMGNHVVTSQIEHPSIMNTCSCIEQDNYLVNYLPVDECGMVDPEMVERAMTPNTILVSVMHGNNEIGTIEPIKEIAEIAHKHGAFFHTDAVQTVGKVPIDVKEMGMDFLSLSGHKFNGPKGIGGLYHREDLHLCPLVHGGHQEASLRAGTENNLGIIGLGKAAEIAMRGMATEIPALRKLRDRLQAGIEERISDIKINGHPTERLPGVLNVSFKYVEGESILLRLDSAGIAVSTGSACSTGSLEPSHVLLAIGLSHELAHGSIRFSLGPQNTDDEIDYVLEQLPKVISSLREMSPLYSAALGE